MTVCGHPRVDFRQAGDVVDAECRDCKHHWQEHAGNLEFASEPTLEGALLLMDRETRETCGDCGHSLELHDLLGGCMFHDSEGPCVCRGFCHA